MLLKLIFIFSVIAGILNSLPAIAQITPGNNDIGVDVSTFPQNATFTYDSCFALGVKAGMSRVGIFQNWTAIETAPHQYDLTILDIANIYYPAQNMPIDLTITPIHTNNLEVPTDLTTTAFDDPLMIERFKTLLDSVKAHIPDVTLASLVIGSEHDVYLGSNQTHWAQYTSFYNAVTTYAKLLWPGLKVATELTFKGITTQNTYAQTLNTNSDYIGVSYYPLNNDFTVKPVSTIPDDFATLVNLYPTNQICFYQYGYPSSTTCNSSEAKQAQFMALTFNTWDVYATHIKLIDFTWLHDLDTDQVNYYGKYYGITDAAFLEYLRTLGLRTWNGNGTNKPAFTTLICEAKQRSYNNADVNCVTGVETADEAHLLNIFPNPVREELNIETPWSLKPTDLKIYNQLGELQRTPSITTNAMTARLSTATMCDGLYIVVLDNGTAIVSKKFFIAR